MTYYIVFNEWNYPTNSGREYVGDYDSLGDAKEQAEIQYELERNNFIEVNNGEIYEQACGEVVDYNQECVGYYLNSSPIEEENFFFRSIIIKREV